jgi:hypothetical protein
MGLYFGGGWGGWGGWGWRPGWGNHSVFVNNSFIHRNNFNSGASRSLSGNTAWSHDSSHREGVPYSNAAVSSRYGGAVRQNLQSRAAAGPAQSRAAGEQPQSRSGTSSSGAERMGNRQIAPSASRSNGSAFGGVRNGSAARAHSDHGYSSLGAARSAGSSRGASSGGVSHGGGHGGGGGHR